MPRPSVLFHLRFTAIVLFLLVLSDIETVIEIFTINGFHNMKNSLNKRTDFFHPAKPISWEEIDLKKPPFLNDTAPESLRLNEFLARPIYTCKNRTEIGGDYDGFFYCFDRTPEDGIQKPLLITGALYAEGDFEKRLRADRWKVFLPHATSLLEDLNGDVEVNYVPSLSEWKAWDLNEVTRNLEAAEHFSLAKIDLYTPLLPETQLLEIPKLVDRLIPYVRTDQLLLTIRIEEPEAAETLFQWYSTVYRLFYVSNFALVGAEASGNCGVPLKHCRYRATFAKTDVFGVREVPVFGLGSPIEEQRRLQQYLSRIELNCTSKTDFVPAICLDNLNAEDCHLNFFSYRKTDPQIFRSHPCKVTLFDPESQQDSRELPPNVEVVQQGISTCEEPQTVPGHAKTSKWHLFPLREILEGRQKEILIFDLEGGEWNLLGDITTDCDFFAEVRQVAFTLRLWFGEENENFRRFHVFFLRIEHCGFRKTVAHQVTESEFSVAFQSVRLVYG
ncbi:hypothetical protein QR680_017198 [Steinernema hermaphroditum]|uniref:Methyltransferase FkbM domain-containing protein n=1 Tax=Steinernema hermaphroditum TaxID=289476 RepID=A0AA39HDP9_9BILA|nr:hypothetical protein QR680_017198 [Steinernema hermaphroditum]